MEQPAIPPLIHPPAERRWLWVVVLVVILIPLVALGGLAFGVTSYFRLSSDTRALRNELTKASGTEWRKQIGLNIGDTTLGLARGVLLFTKVEPEVKTALGAVHGVEVGIYELDSTSKAPDRTAMLNAADKAMSRRGWERVVGVLDGDQMVGVFVPVKITSANRLKCCVAVLDGRKLIVVSASADPQPLLEFVRNQPDWREGIRSLASR